MIRSRTLALNRPVQAWKVVRLVLRFVRGLAILLMSMSFADCTLRADPPAVADQATTVHGAKLRQRLEQSLERWCRWLARNVEPIPDTDLYTFHPTLGGYRAVAGNQFAAAAAGYWLERAAPEEDVSRPLRGLIKLALGTHVGVKTVDLPERILPWGATYSEADDWHADLFSGTSGMLMLGGLPPEQKSQLRRILEWEADWQVECGFEGKRFHVVPELGGRSVGESNAWSTATLQVARLALPDSPRQEAWREAAVTYSLNTICVPADRISDQIVAGKPLRERVEGANFEPGGIQEHHGFYHPGYMAWPLAYQAYAQLLDESMPPKRRNPDVYLRNWQPVFERLKQGTLSNGRFIYCAGSDWINYGYGNAHILPIGIFAATRFGDRDAARLADEWLKLVEHEQSLSGGAAQGVRLATMQRLYPKDFGWYEAISGASLAQALWVMDHMDTSRMAPPSTEEEYNANNVGTYHEPGARLAWHRDRHRFASFSWRSAFGEWQALVQPVGLPNLLRFNHNSTGILEATGTSAKAVIGPSSTGTFAGGGFWSLGNVDRLVHEDNPRLPLVREHQALVVLPDGPSIFINQCRALDEISLARNGALGMRLAADIFNDNRVNLAADGKTRSFGVHPERNMWHDLGTRSVVIEGLLAIDAPAGEGSFQLLQTRSRPSDRTSMIDKTHDGESLASHALYFGPAPYDPPRKVVAGEWFRDVVLVLRCGPEIAAGSPATVTGRPPCVAIHLNASNLAVAVNFAETEQTVETPKGRMLVPPRSVLLR